MDSTNHTCPFCLEQMESFQTHKRHCQIWQSVKDDNQQALAILDQREQFFKAMEVKA